jgi:hypothetical protein
MLERTRISIKGLLAVVLVGFRVKRRATENAPIFANA